MPRQWSSRSSDSNDGESAAQAYRGLSDEEVAEWWLDSPYAQKFCGETHFQQESQLDASSLS